MASEVERAKLARYSPADARLAPALRMHRARTKAVSAANAGTGAKNGHPATAQMVPKCSAHLHSQPQHAYLAAASSASPLAACYHPDLQHALIPTPASPLPRPQQARIFPQAVGQPAPCLRHQLQMPSSPPPPATCPNHQHVPSPTRPHLQHVFVTDCSMAPFPPHQAPTKPHLQHVLVNVRLVLPDALLQLLPGIQDIQQCSLPPACRARAAGGNRANGQKAPGGRMSTRRGACTHTPAHLLP